MSNMLEQAIVDAKALREAAMKSAEASIVEKYSDEVRSAVHKLLEQDEDMPGEPESGEDSLAGNTAMENVPMAHVTEEDDEVVVVDLDDIISAAEQEDQDNDEFTLDRGEIADEIGINLGSEVSDSPANRTEEDLDLDEEELVSMFKEMLSVDVPEVELERAEERLNKDELEEDEASETRARKDGMDKEDVRELKNKIKENKELQKENGKLVQLLEKVKSKLEELNLQNARLLYANRVLSDSSLNEQQKTKIAELVSSARSVDEAKMVVETLHKTMANGAKADAKSLSEVISKPSSVILGGNRRNEPSADKNPTYNRWAALAGMNNTEN
jgi:hypothetical protein